MCGEEGTFGEMERNHCDANTQCSRYLYFPECFGTGGGGGRLSQGGPEEDVLLIPVLVTCQELLLLGVEQTHHITLTNRETKHGLAVWAKKQKKYFKVTLDISYQLSINSYNLSIIIMMP